MLFFHRIKMVFFNKEWKFIEKFILNRSWIIILLLLVPFGCATPRVDITEKIPTGYRAQKSNKIPAERFAPFFVTHNHRDKYNRIGRVIATPDQDGKEQLSIDPGRPAIYFMVRPFSSAKASYTNFIYRVHFQKTPFSIIPFYLGAGKNLGLLVIVTVNSQNTPVLVTTVNTCGCYVAVTPTTALPEEAFPENWEKEPLKVYGETLPPILQAGDLQSPRLIVYIRPDVHRVMDLEFVDDDHLGRSNNFHIIEASLFPMADLTRVVYDGKETSFFYDRWPLRGHVKGAVKPWESLFLSLISLDFFVGMDKQYGDSEITGNPFYTSLKPWNRKASDLWEFGRFLKFYGWKL